MNAVDNDELSLCTVLAGGLELLTPGLFKDAIDRFLTTDDVWSQHFAHDIVLASASLDRAAVAEEAARVKNSLGIRNLYLASQVLSEVPYAIIQGQLRQVYRLYPDTADAFIASTIASPDDPDRYGFACILSSNFHCENR